MKFNRGGHRGIVTEPGAVATGSAMILSLPLGVL